MSTPACGAVLLCVSSLAGGVSNDPGPGHRTTQPDEVTDIAWDAVGNLLVSDGDLNGLNNRVLKLNPKGQVIASWSASGGKPGSGPGQFNLPHAVLDPSTWDVYLTVLGGNLPPQKWVAMWPEGRRSNSH